MKKKLLLFPFVLLLVVQLYAQQNLPPVYEIKTDTLQWQVINNHYWQVLGDKEEKWTIGEVTQVPLINNFADSSKAAAANTYWLRFTLKNTMTHEARISLNSMCEYDDFYVSDSAGIWKHFVSGKSNPWSKKDGLKKLDCIPVIIPPGKSLSVYQRIHNRRSGFPENFTIAIPGTDKIIQEYYVDSVHSRRNIFETLHLQEAFIIGFLLFASLFNLFFFGIVKERVYLYFALFLFFLATLRCINIFGTYLGGANPALYEYTRYMPLAWVFIQFFLIQFIRYFFKLWLSFKKWDIFLNGVSFFIAVFMLTDQLFTGNGILRTILDEFYDFIFFIIFFPLLTTLFLFIPQSRHHRFTRLMIMAAFPFICFYSITSIFDVLIHFFQNNRPISGVQDWINKWFRPIEIICMSWFVLFSSRILFLRYSQLQKDNAQQALDKERLAREKELEKSQLIEQQNVLLEKQVEERTHDLKQSLEDLKSTQSQLIQSEKMASLGELTAGIAHEIQNPLNFVNNFSEVSTELIKEMVEEVDKGNTTEVKAIANDLVQNLEKINHHGKRADAIVKGMLQHSRSSSGQKEPTDINALCDEYLRLSYHGLRAKDKSFNATLRTDFDNSIGKINIIPQDIGRVILNLITNAFYAVAEKKKQQGNDYEPTVTVSTGCSPLPGSGVGSEVRIKVTDNGNGIPKSLIDKIFQPFFTTKPTGQGTGLGLSLSYDIVKAHGGELKVETKENEGSQFIIQLPIV